MTLEDQNKILKAALDQILNGTLIDPLNHNDDGLKDFGPNRIITRLQLNVWINHAAAALAVAK